ncbi:guanine nucleotide-binding protein subunit alpha [Tilletia horrida]|nr:guanine nucleotide-binding protein subunit alpha [Tilletia horrida]
MGCGPSKQDREGQQRNDEIEAQLRKDRMAMRSEIKMLLLGAGESGKSTILKQMKLINHGSYSREERLSYKDIIFSNTLQSMRVILDAMDQLDIPLADGANARRAEVILSLPAQIEADHMPRHIAEAIYGLYFDSIERMADPDYVPTDQDVLRSRVKTTGITETHFQIGELHYRLFDVGGQRSERKKWIHCFENVTAIIFLVAISEYDQLLYEDGNVNRMQEALTLFDSICNSRWFTRTSIILFLNKIDLFKAKLPISPMGEYFSDYTGGDNYDAACEYIVNRFVSLNQSDSKTIYTHL